MRPRLALLGLCSWRRLRRRASRMPAPRCPTSGRNPGPPVAEIRRSHPPLPDANPAPAKSGSPRYRLRWLTPEGRVIWLDADARTGRVMGQALTVAASIAARKDCALETPRGNLRAPSPAYEDDEGPPSRFGNRFAPRPGFDDGGAITRAGAA